MLQASGNAAGNVNCNCSDPWNLNAPEEIPELAAETGSSANEYIMAYDAGSNVKVYTGGAVKPSILNESA